MNKNSVVPPKSSAFKEEWFLQPIYCPLVKAHCQNDDDEIATDLTKQLRSLSRKGFGEARRKMQLSLANIVLVLQKLLWVISTIAAKLVKSMTWHECAPIEPKTSSFRPIFDRILCLSKSQRVVESQHFTTQSPFLDLSHHLDVLKHGKALLK